jgi:hypothetical protein
MAHDVEDTPDEIKIYNDTGQTIIVTPPQKKGDVVSIRAVDAPILSGVVHVAWGPLDG